MDSNIQDLGAQPSLEESINNYRGYLEDSNVESSEIDNRVSDLQKFLLSKNNQQVVGEASSSESDTSQNNSSLVKDKPTEKTVDTVAEEHIQIEPAIAVDKQPEETDTSSENVSESLEEEQSVMQSITEPIKNTLLDEASSEELLLALLLKTRKSMQNINISLSNDTINKLSEAITSVNSDDIEPYKWNSSYNKTINKNIIGVTIDEVISKLRIKKAVLIKGVPGTGKSQLMYGVLDRVKNGNNVMVVSFNQNTDYSDFIGGIRCSKNGIWRWQPGIFTKFCQLADQNRDKEYYIGIDEMSRGNTEAIFGEVMSAIESRDREFSLTDGHTFKVPSNVNIIATMNTLDKSTKYIDNATQNRFVTISVEPQWTEDYMNNCIRFDSLLAGSRLTLLKIELSKVIDYMQEVNKILRNEDSKTTDNVIGLRGISVDNASETSLADSIEGILIPDIKNKMQICSKNTRNSLEKYIVSIEKVANKLRSNPNGIVVNNSGIVNTSGQPIQAELNKAVGLTGDSSSGNTKWVS